jgi:hypothetical protein
MMTTSGAFDAASAWLTPRAKPRFSALRSRRACGANSPTIAALPSVEALSTTTASHGRPDVSPAIDLSADRSSEPAL